MKELLSACGDAKGESITKKALKDILHDHYDLDVRPYSSNNSRTETHRHMDASPFLLPRVLMPGPLNPLNPAPYGRSAPQLV